MVEHSATEIIERWRALERELNRLDPDGTHHDSVQLEIQRLRHEYQRVCGRALATVDQLQAASRETLSRVARSAHVSEMARVQLRRVRGSSGAPEAETG